jgi:hypothetical protein
LPGILLKIKIRVCTYVQDIHTLRECPTLKCTYW